MKNNEKMLFGLSIIAMVILFHLAYMHLLYTDFLGLIGVVIIFKAWNNLED